ncbi:hypothetical protein GCM10017744_030320 [Streptomyces antimycoticus]
MIDEFLAGDLGAVEEAIRTAVADEVMPRYRQLAAHEIVEKKGPHDLVTTADRQAEEHLTDALTKLLPGSVVVGEEAVHADPAVLTALGGDAPVWIVDPVDGTRQFVHGDPGFATLVTLAHGEELLASWTYAPVFEQMAIARRGGGALLNGEPIHCGSRSPARSSTSPSPTTTSPPTRRSAPCRACRCRELRCAPAVRPVWSI